MKTKHPFYLSPTTTVFKDGRQFADCFGLFESWGSYHIPSTHECPVWALDNGCFTDKWNERDWIAMLDFYADEEKENCLFAATPDVVYDKDGTFARFKKYSGDVRERGYPVALCTQDGMTPSMIPWEEIDCLFIGGSDDHKRGREAGRLISAGINRGKWIHVGRVNSGVLMLRKFWMADSWDGQTLARHPNHQYERIGRAVREIRGMRNGLQLSLPLELEWAE